MHIETFEERYAKLLVNYSLDLKEGDRVFIRSTFLAEPLIKELYKEVLKVGAFPHFDISWDGKTNDFYQFAQSSQLDYIDVLDAARVNDFEAYLFVRAPYNLASNRMLDQAKVKRRSQALKGLNETYAKRTGTRELRRSLCEYPTQASAQNANMSLAEYRHFVYDACKLFDENPSASWKQLRANQQAVTDMLNASGKIRYVNEGTDIVFSTKGRTWINSDGTTNMPSGEIFTSPVEDSVNGFITFDLPSVHQGHEVKNVRLQVKDGYIEKWDASSGKDYLDQIFKLEGTRRFGEAAIGTNYSIQRQTKNILFDEKIGGTVHMAIGQSYQQAGGMNKSTIHWDMISSMKNGGQIWVDDVLVYENGHFSNFEL